MGQVSSLIVLEMIYSCLFATELCPTPAVIRVIPDVTDMSDLWSLSFPDHSERCVASDLGDLVSRH
jgi:hypothetical protein